MTLLLLLAACDDPPVQAPTAEPWPETLSAWNLFVGEPSELNPNEGVLPYALNTPLFTDYADKLRTVYVPEGQSAEYNDSVVFALPVGSVLSKTFAYPHQEGSHAALEPGSAGETHRLLETRLLVHGEEGWVGLPYVWRADGSDADLQVIGAEIPVSLTRPSGERVDIVYLVPNANQCKGCHETAKDRMSPIGPSARQLKRPSPYAEGGPDQLAQWARAGVLTGLPADDSAIPRLAVWDDPGSGSLEERARAYLDIQCAHCHSETGPGSTSGLMLGHDVELGRSLGRCKPPVASGKGSGGLDYDIVPGSPEGSILVHRMASTEPEAMMPELGRTLAHEEGVALVSAWIEAMEGRCEAGENLLQGGEASEG